MSALLDALTSGAPADNDAAEGRADLRRALMKLPQEDRSVLWWTHCGYGKREVALRTWGTSTPGRASLAYRGALDRLLDHMNGREGD